ncbi:putative DNA-binding domain-containing protein [Aquabacterium sp.]|uniref:HvfC/BufC family peptide modification chaperone n=1 Tax=Aquabacterium sp. TaxID=1872578 RepID=UPI003784F012
MTTASMQALRGQQLAFAAAVADGAPCDALLMLHAGGQAPLISAYRHAYVARLTEALGDNFEILLRAMGDEAFAALAAAYIAAHPSTVPSIRWFGHRLADFMATQVETDSGLVPHPAFVDLARMDWALRGAFDAADAPAIGREALAGVAPEDFATLRFTPHPSLRLQPLDWAIEAAWRTLREHDPAAGGDEPELPAPEAAAHTLLVWRRELQTLWRSLEADEAALLQALVQGASFGDLCEQAAAFSDDPAARAAGLLARWLDEGLLAGRRA